MAATRADRRLAAILVADIVGYSRLIERDEHGTLSRFKAHRKAFVEPLIAEHGGQVVKLTGDGVLCEFPSIVDATHCAILIQRGMTEREKDVPDAERIRFRIGINLGDVIHEEGDLYGDGVNIAARLEQLAEPGGVAVSGTAYDQMHGKLDLPLAFAGEQRVKNMDRPVRVYRVLLDGRAPARWPVSQSSWQSWPAGAAALALLLVAAVAGGWWWYEHQAEPGQPAATAGLPQPSSRGAEEPYLASGEPEITPQQLDATLNPSEWQAIQNALRDLGYYQGVTDGRPSYAVRTAIWEFQLAQGVTSTGYLTVPQMVELHMLSRYKHPATALPEFDLADVLRRSEAGDPEAQRLRAQVHDTWYQDGGLPKDNVQATRWYRKAAEAGDLDAALNLGWLLKEGDGVEPDLAEAVHWLELAVQGGDPGALGGLAELYEHGGKGVRQDRDKAIRLYRRAAELPGGGVAIAKLRALGAWPPEQSAAAQAER
jgi:class 3 adenylate cyclase/TPR repeat protein